MTNRAIDLTYDGTPDRDLPERRHWMHQFCRHCGSQMAWKKAEQDGFCVASGRPRYWWYWVCPKREDEPRHWWKRLLMRKRQLAEPHDWDCMLSTATGEMNDRR